MTQPAVILNLFSLNEELFLTDNLANVFQEEKLRQNWNYIYHIFSLYSTIWLLFYLLSAHIYLNWLFDIFIKLTFTQIDFIS